MRDIREQFQKKTGLLCGRLFLASLVQLVFAIDRKFKGTYKLCHLLGLPGAD